MMLNSTSVLGEEAGKIFVGGLHPLSTATDLIAHFSQFGHVLEANIKEDKETKRSRGFGFVKFQDPQSVKLALDYASHVINDKLVDPKICAPQGQRPPRASAVQQKDLSKKIFVGGIPGTASEVDIMRFFQDVGQVEEVTLMRDNNNRSRGFGFVTFENEASVQLALRKQYFIMDNKRVEVKAAEPRTPGGGTAPVPTTSTRLTAEKMKLLMDQSRVNGNNAASNTGFPPYSTGYGAATSMGTRGMPGQFATGLTASGIASPYGAPPVSYGQSPAGSIATAYPNQPGATAYGAGYGAFAAGYGNPQQAPMGSYGASNPTATGAPFASYPQDNSAFGPTRAYGSAVANTYQSPQSFDQNPTPFGSYGQLPPSAGPGSHAVKGFHPYR